MYVAELLDLRLDAGKCAVSDSEATVKNDECRTAGGAHVVPPCFMNGSKDRSGPAHY